MDRSEIASISEHKNNSQKAFENLVLFEPFLNQKSLSR
jgi:hypothetical protein